jgi:hypothetical protein
VVSSLVWSGKKLANGFISGLLAGLSATGFFWSAGESMEDIYFLSKQLKTLLVK